MMPGSPSIAARAAYTLRDNSTGLITKAAPALYPHQWSWDAAFNAIGLATVDLPRARLELDSLFAGQWRNGLLPHIVFDPAAATDGYWPGPAQWQCSLHNEDAAAAPATSGIVDPPVHAIAVDRILSIATASGGREAELTWAWASGIYPKLLAWHRFLARDRTDKSTGLMTLFHGWESGTDNSPRWDAPYASVEVGVGLPAYTRRDKAHVSDACQRPTDHEYDRYLWLVEEAKAAGYDAGLLRETGSFQVGDVLFTAIFAVASDLLSALARSLRQFDEADELKDYAVQARAAVFCHVDESSGPGGRRRPADRRMAADRDLRRVRAADRRGHARLDAVAFGVAADGTAVGGAPVAFVPAAAFDLALLACLRPRLLLAGAGLAGLHLAAVLGAAAVRGGRGGVRAAVVLD